MTVDDTLRTIVRDVVRAELASAIESFRAAVRAGLGSTSSGYLTTDQAAERAAVKPATIRQWVRERKLPEYRAGRELRVRTSDLDALLAVPQDDVDRAVVLELRRLDGETR